jgi:hypothetical protein
MAFAFPPAGWESTNYQHRSMFQSDKNCAACGHYESEEAGDELKKK